MATPIPPTVLPPHLVGIEPVRPSKPNWIQEAEAIAKADITRLEGKLKRLCSSVTGSMAVSVIAFVVASAALFKSCH